ncbi:secretin N-terminal domain-containing protein [Antarcticirhabdus aurantiaca]|uniref:Uncharacterized protein n=1 Tax=Antarcticirhabdus aurantiaca TaxID=2606717 RepID=A0ACD4NUH1_9HYPH|nr:secretin N-terminal domain-containing protein [Antarcticirhabdus aurantiaca]WAJ30488.1 hypothetical protein OXU80_09915 [Jeongeuplla avenae]
MTLSLPAGPSSRRGGRARRWIARPAISLLALSVALSGCASSGIDDPDLFTTGTVQPRLQNGEPQRVGPIINAAAFNARAVSRTIAPYAGFVGSTRVNYAGERSAIEADLRDLGNVVAPSFDPNELVTIDFRDATLAYILQQLLGGALGVTYVAPEQLPQSVNFRTETPIPKSRVLQVVRDLLAREGLVIRLINGVYQIGTLETLTTLETNAAAGRTGEEVSRIVKLSDGNAAEVAQLASQLLPAGTSVQASTAANTLVIKASPSDIESVERLVRTLSETAVGSEQVAIIPLRRSAPEAVAAQLTEFYGSSLRGEGEPITAIPLQNQQAILVGTSDPTLMAGLQQLARQLDRSVTDVSGLRVVPLTHIRAVEIAPQLSQIFGSSVASGPTEARSTGTRSRIGGSEREEAPASRIGAAARLRAPNGSTAIDDNEDGTGLALAGPTAAGNVRVDTLPAEGGANARGGRVQAEAAEETSVASTALAPSPGETRIVAEERTNSLLVYSTYDVFNRIQDTVRTLDVPQAQVIIEATVIEVQLNDRLESGVQFFLQSNGIVVGSGIPDGNQSPTQGGIIGVGADIGNVTVDAVLRALRAVTNLRVVSSPYLTVVDGASARLVIGDQIPFATRSQRSNNLGNITVTQDVEILDTGVVLEITPRIFANNSVKLNVVQSVSTPSSSAAAGDLTPVISTRDIESQILGQSGRTILLGGLISDRIEKGEDATPVASQVPVIGQLFRQNRSTAQRTELLVLITPRVVRTSSGIESITRLIQGVRVQQQVNEDIYATTKN